eukprot:3520569-Rhodomonas_salina.1
MMPAEEKRVRAREATGTELVTVAGRFNLKLDSEEDLLVEHHDHARASGKRMAATVPMMAHMIWESSVFVSGKFMVSPSAPSGSFRRCFAQHGAIELHACYAVPGTDVG